MVRSVYTLVNAYRRFRHSSVCSQLPATMEPSQTVYSSYGGPLALLASYGSKKELQHLTDQHPAYLTMMWSQLNHQV